VRFQITGLPNLVHPKKYTELLHDELSAASEITLTEFLTYKRI